MPGSRDEISDVICEARVFLILRQDEGLARQGLDLQCLDLIRQVVIGWHCEQQPFLPDNPRAGADWSPSGAGKVVSYSTGRS